MNRIIITMIIALIYVVLGLLLFGCLQQEPLSTPTITPTLSTPIPYSGTKIEYPGCSTKVALPVPNQSLTHPPYHPYNLNPEPGAEDVPLDANISLSFPRPPSLLKLEIEPEVKISHAKQELIFYSGKYTFYLAEPLQPGTKYSVKVTVGQEEPPGPGFSPTLTTSWNFTTIMPEINLTPKQGEYFTLQGNATRILLVNSHLKYKFLSSEDMCPPAMEWSGAKVGDLGVILNGIIKNEYDGNKWVCLHASAYNSTSERVGGILDQGHICGSIRVYVKARQSEQFQMHLKYRKDIERIEILCGCVSEIMPP